MIKRVSGYEIHNDLPKVNAILSNEINAIHNDIWICLDGNRTRFELSDSTQQSLDSLYKLLDRYKREGRF